MNHLTNSRIWATCLLLWFGMSCYSHVWAQHMMKGKASYYADYMHGKQCANGSLYNKNDFTCAHRTLPFGTVLKVTNLNNGLSTMVTVTDRGPYSKGRVIDLTRAAAQEIKMIASGVAPVMLEIISGNLLLDNKILHNFLDEQILSLSKQNEFMHMFRLIPEELEPQWMDKSVHQPLPKKKTKKNN